MTNVITKKRSSLEKQLAGGLVSCYMRAKKEGLGSQIKKKQSKFKFGEPSKPIIVDHFDYDSDDSDFEPGDDESDGSEDNDIEEVQEIGDSQQQQEDDDEYNQEFIDYNLNEISIDPPEDDNNINNDIPVVQRQKRKPPMDYYMLQNCRSSKK